MFTSTVLNPDVGLADGSGAYPRVNKLLGDYVTFITTTCGNAVTVISDNAATSTARIIVLQIRDSDHYLHLITSSATTNRYITASIRNLANDTSIGYASSFYVYRTTSVSTVSTRAYIAFSDDIFTTYTGLVNDTSFKIFYLKLTDDTQAACQDSATVGAGNDYCYVDGSDTKRFFRGAEASYGYVTDTGAEIMMPARLRTAAGVISATTFKNNLFRIGNIGTYAVNDIIKDGDGNYYLALCDKYILG